MSLSHALLNGEDIHPIDIVETLAAHHDWEFDRLGDDQIAMAVEGKWRTYSLTLAWSPRDETLRLVCTFEMEPSDDRLAPLHEALNRINDQVWGGCFSYWRDQQLMVWRYGLMLAGGQTASPGQIDCMIGAAVTTAERYYPALQLVCWSEQSVDEAMQVAIAEAYGRA